MSLDVEMREGLVTGFIIGVIAIVCIAHIPGSVIETTKTAIKECEKLNSPLMAHIVQYPNNYPYISDQFVVLNLQKWKDYIVTLPM